jgi:hypothetical protein
MRAWAGCPITASAPADAGWRPAPACLAAPGFADMMLGMRRLWTDRLVTISGGVAVLLLVAAQQKICPRLLTPPHSPAKNGVSAGQTGPATAPVGQAPANPDGPGRPNPGQKRAPLALTNLLPDAIPARWASVPTRAALEEHVGWRDGLYALGPLTPPRSGAAPDQAALPPWLGLAAFPPAALIDAGGAPVRPEPHRHPALETVIRRTGPPSA